LLWHTPLQATGYIRTIDLVIMEISQNQLFSFAYYTSFSS